MATEEKKELGMFQKAARRAGVSAEIYGALPPEWGSTDPGDIADALLDAGVAGGEELDRIVGFMLRYAPQPEQSQPAVTPAAMPTTGEPLRVIMQQAQTDDDLDDDALIEMLSKGGKEAARAVTVLEKKLYGKLALYVMVKGVLDVPKTKAAFAYYHQSKGKVPTEVYGITPVLLTKVLAEVMPGNPFDHGNPVPPGHPVERLTPEEKVVVAYAYYKGLRPSKEDYRNAVRNLLLLRETPDDDLNPWWGVKTTVEGLSNDDPDLVEARKLLIYRPGQPVPTPEQGGRGPDQPPFDQGGSGQKPEPRISGDMLKSMIALFQSAFSGSDVDFLLMSLGTSVDNIGRGNSLPATWANVLNWAIQQDPQDLTILKRLIKAAILEREARNDLKQLLLQLFPGEQMPLKKPAFGRAMSGADKQALHNALIHRYPTRGDLATAVAFTFGWGMDSVSTAEALGTQVLALITKAESQDLTYKLYTMVNS
jgi:hypothetical protein